MLFKITILNILFPPKEMMSDNAAMIAWNCLNKNIETFLQIFTLKPIQDFQ